MTTTRRIGRDRVQVPTGDLKDLQVFRKADADDRPLEISPFEDCLALRNPCQTRVGLRLRVDTASLESRETTFHPHECRPIGIGQFSIQSPGECCKPLDGLNIECPRIFECTEGHVRTACTCLGDLDDPIGAGLVTDAIKNDHLTVESMECTESDVTGLNQLFEIEDTIEQSSDEHVDRAVLRDSRHATLHFGVNDDTEYIHT